MNKEKLLKLYEKLYFHEIESREKLTGRLQLPLAILVVELGLIGYMLNNKAQVDFSYYVCSFWSFYLLSCISITLAICYFIKSWYGYEYSFIPSPSSIEVYKKQLIVFYKDDANYEDQVEKALNDFLYNYYANCSSKNTDNNDKRSISMHKTSTFLIASIVLLFFSFIPFYFGDFDKLKKAQPVIITAPIELISSNDLIQPKPLISKKIINNPKSKENKKTENTTAIKKDAPPTPPAGGNGNGGSTK